MILEPPSKSQMDVLNVATKTVVKSLISFFEELEMMGRDIDYPSAMDDLGLMGYRTYFEDEWKEFQFRRSVGYKIHTRCELRQITSTRNEEKLFELLS